MGRDGVSAWIQSIVLLCFHLIEELKSSVTRFNKQPKKFRALNLLKRTTRASYRNYRELKNNKFVNWIIESTVSVEVNLQAKITVS